jgi:hypothetical protein
MAIRVVNDNDHTEDGWPLVDQLSCTWCSVPGTNDTVHLQIQNGQPFTIMGAFAADYHAYVMPIFEDDSACWTEGNSVLGQPGQNNGSNHLGGTAMDLRWNIHKFQVSYDGYSQAQIDTVREILAYYEDTIFWGEDWGLQGIGPFDCMHFQMGYNTFGNPHTQDFINRKIRSDGFSTFRRGSTVPPPVLSRPDRYALLIIAEGRRLGITPRGIMIALATGLVESGLTNYANSNDPPSLDLPHDAVGSDHMSVGWAQQQPNWGTLQCRMDVTCAATLFFTCDNGPGTRGLTKIRDGDDNLYDYNDTSNTPGFYAQKVQGSEFPDRYDQRFGEATDLYNRLAGAPLPPPIPPPQPPGDDMALVPQDQWNNFYNAFMNMYHAYMDNNESLSPLRHVGEGQILPLHRAVRNIDGSVHLMVEALLSGLRYPDPESLALLNEVANADLAAHPERARDQRLARAILAGPPPAALAAVQPTQQEVAPYLPVPIAPLPLPVANEAPKNLGEVVKTVIDAVEELDLASALSIQDRATLAASIKILEMKNGSQI